MKSSEAILEEVRANIEGIHLRPSMYSGGKDRREDPFVLDALLWNDYRLWASIQDREGEFRRVVECVRQRHDCGSLGFAYALHWRRSPVPVPEEACDLVLSFWLEVADELGLEIEAT